MTTPPTPPRPEPVALTGRLLREHGRGLHVDRRVECSACQPNALADALGPGWETQRPGMFPPRPEPVATADLVERAREAADEYRAEGIEDADLLTALAKALEDTAAERDRAHATLRAIRDDRNEYGDALAGAQRLARERLANP